MPPKRETAHRLFASEFNASRHEFKESDDERSPSFVLSPLGAKVNRILVVGVLTDVEPVGESGDVHRARVSDPTGLFTIYAGRYQPEAAAAIRALQPPQYVAVVGKARTYEPEPGKLFTSLRPESITVVDEHVRDHWILEAARQTMARVKAAKKALETNGATVETLETAGVPRYLAEGAILAKDKYAGDVDLDYFRRITRDAVADLAEGAQTFSEAPAAVTVKPKATGPEDEIEKKVLAIVQGLAQTDERGAQWDLIVEKGRKESITEDQVEESLNALMDKGIVYEPILGRLKLA